MVANDGVNTDYYADEAKLEANIIILSKLANKAVETKFLV